MGGGGGGVWGGGRGVAVGMDGVGLRTELFNLFIGNVAYTYRGHVAQFFCNTICSGIRYLCRARISKRFLSLRGLLGHSHTVTMLLVTTHVLETSHYPRPDEGKTTS